MTNVADRDRSPRLLLVEDNRGDVLLLQRAFARAAVGLDLTLAGSGERALEYLALAVQDGTLPDLIVLDMNLPGISGLDLLDIVKADSRFRRLPVLVLSSSAADADVTASYDRFASGYVTKPMDTESYDLVASIVSSYWFRLTQSNPEARPPCKVQDQADGDDATRYTRRTR